ncbi:hypothetical protein B7463_g4061, partial [Scytalidium lignicola]
MYPLRPCAAAPAATESLIQRLDQLRATRAATALASVRQERLLEHQPADLIKSPPVGEQACSPAVIQKDIDDGFDNHFSVSTETGLNSRFYGKSSIFTLTVEVLTAASSLGIYFPSPPLSNHLVADGSVLNDGGAGPGVGTGELSENIARSLIKLYLQSVNVIYPFIDQDAANADLELYLRLSAGDEWDPANLHGDEAHTYFRVLMICAIASTIRSKHQLALVTLKNRCYSDAMRFVEEVTSEVSSRSLQAMLLLMIYCLLYPRKGNISRLLEFASRLSVQLGYHTEGNTPPENDEQQMSLRKNLFQSLYSIERLVGHYFGRPSDLPENLVTTFFGTSLDTAPGQLCFSDHTVRLMNIRSEIYKEIYLPAHAPFYDNHWYSTRFAALSQWHQELQKSDFSTSCALIHCDLLFHSSVIFLFQALILQTISTLGNAASQAASSYVLWAESYWSAGELIRLPNGTDLATLLTSVHKVDP